MKGFRWFCLILLAAVPLQAQNLYKQFEYVSVEGVVVARDGTPVANCNVEIRTLSNQSTQSDTTPGDDSIPTGWGARTGNALGTDTHDVNNLAKAGWAKTDKDGHYRIDGIASPGDYVLLVKGMKGYKKTQMPLRVEAPKDTVVKAPDLVLDAYKAMSGKVKKLFSKAAKELKKDNTAEAKNLLLEINQLEPDHSEVYVSLGNIYMKEKDQAKAYDMFSKAFDLGEHNPEICRILMQMSFQKQEFARTGEYVEVFLKENPDDLNAIYLAGVCHYNLQDFEGARPYFVSFLEKKGDMAKKDAGFMYAFGMTELALKHGETAAEYLQTALNLGWRPTPGYLKDLANLYIEQRRFPEAKSVLKDLLEKFPQFNGREEVESIYAKLP